MPMKPPYGFQDYPKKLNYNQYAFINTQAHEYLELLRDAMLDVGYFGRILELYLVRLMFCLFADHTGILIQRGMFHNWLEIHTATDGNDLAPKLCELFQALSISEEQSLKPSKFFQYVNSQIFTKQLPIVDFNVKIRDILLKAVDLDWSCVSPTIFGSLFQSVMQSKERRQSGTHYTAEANIFKLIGPLFLDDLWTEFKRAQTNPKQLLALQAKLSNLKFLDPACGCGNFLVIAYRELRLLELDILRTLYKSIDLDNLTILCNAAQFHGIEQEEFPVQIARLALWIMDQQLNLLLAEQLGIHNHEAQFKKTATIIHGNALRLNWRTICQNVDFILGNPPFVGKTNRSKEQNTDMDLIFKGSKKCRSLDYVACWYRKATEYMLITPSTRCAFVSTNSITQGEQVGALWPDLLAQGVIIQFAHQTFQWTSEAAGKAAVHCIIIGFGVQDITVKYLFEYTTPQFSPSSKLVDYINPYLIAAPSVIIEARATPICKVRPMLYGNKPIDGGHLLLSTADKAELLAKEPQAAPWIRPLLGAEEFINGKERWCLWLVGIDPEELHAMPEVTKRVTAVKKMRLSSRAETTVKLADTPFLFSENRQPSTGHYILVPRVSSERRPYIPIGFINSNTISTDANQMIPGATVYEFGVLESAMHMAWMRAVAGRLEMSYRYSTTIVYNNFPWPDSNDKHQEAITTAAQLVLDVRTRHPGSTLAHLYDPITMPQDLRQAHHKLDLAVDAAYCGAKEFAGDSDRVALLFELYQKLNQGLF